MSDYLFKHLYTEGVSLANQWRAIYKRRSTAQFSDRRIDDRAMQILAFLDDCPLPFEGADLHMDWIGAQTLEDMLLHDVKRVIPAPQYLIFSALDDDATHYNLGYLLQTLALWLHTQGLGMRIQSHFTSPDPAQGEGSDYEVALGGPRRPRPEMLPVLAAIGEPLMLARRPKHTMRLRPSFFIDHELPRDRTLRSILHVAITAPSDGRSMPWLFMTDGDTVSFFVRTKYRFGSRDKALAARVSMGALLCNVLLAAKLRNVRATLYQAPDVDGIGDFTYVGSCRFEQ